MKNVMVTGAAGFLGSHRAMHHLCAGDRVWGIDDFSSSSTTSDHYRALLEHDSFTMSQGDISDRTGAWASGITHVKFDLIYNFACPASPPKYQRMPIHTMLTCVAGTKNVLDVADRDGSIVVHASTSEVYGDPAVSPQRETYRGCVNPYGPRSCYDEGKRAAESLCYDYKKAGTDARLVRIFNTYGPHMDPLDGRVVSNFICQALRGERLTVYGDGSQTRSFCYVDDLIRGIVTMGALARNPGMPINLGNPTEFTVNDLAREVIHAIYGGQNDERGVARWIERRELPVDDPTQRCPDITNALGVLGWEPKVDLRTGLTRTIGHFSRTLDIDHGHD